MTQQNERCNHPHDANDNVDIVLHGDRTLVVITREEEGKAILIWMETIVRTIRTVCEKHTSTVVRKLHRLSPAKKEEEASALLNSTNLYKEVLSTLNLWIQNHVEKTKNEKKIEDGNDKNEIIKRNKIIHSVLWKKIQEWSIKQKESPNSIIRFDKSGDDNTDKGNHMEDLEKSRHELVMTILVPIVSLFANHYQQLDAVDDNSHKMKDDSNQRETRKDKEGANQTTSQRGRNKKTPKAPNGLLSIVNYIDVACLLEILVSFSILPNLQFSTPKRTLPKSFSTRIPLAALSYPQNNRNNNHHQLKNTSMENNESKKATELSTVLFTLGSLFSLDRFQHILLPRHVTDIYAAIFQLEHFNNKKSKAIQQKWTRMQDWSSMKNGINVNIHLRIKSYQTLLSASAVTAKNSSNGKGSLLKQLPIWLKHRIGQQFHTIATTNILPLLMAFVLQPTHNISNNTDLTQISTAAKRFGTVLTTTPSNDNASPQSDTKTNANDSKSHRCNKKEQYYTLLFQQLIPLLSSNSSENNGNINDAQNKIILAATATTWFILENLNNDSNRMIISKIFFPILTKHFLPNKSELATNTVSMSSKNTESTVLISMRRIRSLLSNTIPTTSSRNIVKRICKLLLFQPLQPSSMETTSTQSSNSFVTVLDQLIRIATASSSNIQYSRIKEEATLTVQMLLHNSMTNNANDRNFKLIQYLQSTSTALLKSIVPHNLDKQGFQFIIEIPNITENDDNGSHLEKIELIQIPQNSSSPSYTNDTKDNIFNVTSSNNFTIEEKNIITMERRIQYIVEHILLPFATEFSNKNLDPSQSQTSTNNHSKRNGDDNESLKRLPSYLFQFLLTIYFQTSDTSNSTNPPIEEKHETSLSSHFLPDIILNNLNDYRLVSMVAIPIICEKCPISSLLLEEQESIFSNNSNAKNKSTRPVSGVLKMITTTIEAAASSYSVMSSSSDHESKNDGSSLLVETNLQDETQLSILSIMLSMLVTMLELGSKKRNVADEELIASILPALRILASNTFRSFRLVKCNGIDDDSINQHVPHEFAAVNAEIADMASHAMALISSRNMNIDTYNEEGEPKNIQKEFNLSIWDRICQAESDLLSNQPPIRARGIVSLRHIVRGYFSENITSDSELEKPLIREIDKNNHESHRVSNTSSEFHNILDSCLGLAIKSLSDEESYVFLAGIQTIVAIGDANPLYIISLIVSALTTGNIKLFTLRLSLENNSEESASKIELSSTQRVKLADALIFIIRRRGDAIFRYYPMLMDKILFGNRNRFLQKEMNIKNNDELLFIHNETDKYFRHGRKMEIDSTDTVSIEEESEERELRCMTGGPVFDSEENDLVRAACILIVSEVVSSVSSSPGALFLSYCSSLVNLASNAMQLDVSRSVRRAAALLCRELYTCLLNESFYSGSSDNISYPIGGDVSSFALELVACGEETLFAALKHCMIDNINDREGSGSHHYDPATEARCQEALEARNLAEDYGILTAARIILKERQKVKNNSFVKMLQREISSDENNTLPIINTTFLR